MDGNRRQNVEYSFTMKTEVLLTLLASLRLPPVQGYRVGSDREIGSKGVERIVNGHTANPSDFPYLVRVHRGSTLCSGSVVSDYYVLTSGHCIHGIDCASLEVFPTTWLPNSRTRIRASKCYVHPKYVATKAAYDTGLVRTLDDLLDDGRFKAIPLPSPGTCYATGTVAVIVGWGKTEHGMYPDRLVRANVLVEDWDRCNHKIKKLYPSCVSDEECPVPDIPLRSLCTQGHGPRPAGTCAGDSGGPVVIKGVLAGVIGGTMMVNGECSPGLPSVHANVPDFLPWIYSHIDPERDTSKFPVTVETNIGHPVGSPLNT